MENPVLRVGVQSSSKKESRSESRVKSCVLSPVGGVSLLLRREQSFSRPSGPAWLAWLEAFGSFLLRLELRVEASSSSSSSSGFVELDLHFVSRPGATHRSLLGVGSSEKRRIDGRIGASSHQHVLRSTGGFAGAREGSWRLDPARCRWSPGPDKLKTTRVGEVRVKL